MRGVYSNIVPDVKLGAWNNLDNKDKTRNERPDVMPGVTMVREGGFVGSIDWNSHGMYTFVLKMKPAVTSWDWKNSSGWM